MKTRTKIFIGLGILLLIGAIVGLILFFTNKRSSPKKCTDPKECETNFCYRGQCRECDAIYTCPRGYTCDSSGKCVLQKGCPDGQFSLDGICVNCSCKGVPCGTILPSKCKNTGGIICGLNGANQECINTVQLDTSNNFTLTPVACTQDAKHCASASFWSSQATKLNNSMDQSIWNFEINTNNENPYIVATINNSGSSPLPISQIAHYCGILINSINESSSIPTICNASVLQYDKLQNQGKAFFATYIKILQQPGTCTATNNCYPGAQLTGFYIDANSLCVENGNPTEYILGDLTYLVEKQLCNSPDCGPGNLPKQISNACICNFYNQAPDKTSKPTGVAGCVNQCVSGKEGSYKLCNDAGICSDSGQGCGCWLGEGPRTSGQYGLVTSPCTGSSCETCATAQPVLKASNANIVLKPPIHDVNSKNVTPYYILAGLINGNYTKTTSSNAKLLCQDLFKSNNCDLWWSNDKKSDFMTVPSASPYLVYNKDGFCFDEVCNSSNYPSCIKLQGAFFGGSKGNKASLSCKSAKHYWAFFSMYELALNGNWYILLNDNSKGDNIPTDGWYGLIASGPVTFDGPPTDYSIVKDVSLTTQLLPGNYTTKDGKSCVTDPIFGEYSIGDCCARLGKTVKNKVCV